MAKIIFMLFLFPILAFCQVKEVERKSDTLSFFYDSSVYQKIAQDTIKSMYLNQKKMLKYSNSMGDDIIALKYNLSDISVEIIPMFRLKRIANEFYTCDKNIENYIEFEEKYKFMSAILLVDNKYIEMQTIPHPYFEMERINNPDFRLKVDRFVYEESILKGFIANEVYLSNIQKDIKKRNNNFFFGIYGLWDVIFEIDIETGLLFANKYDYGSVLHLPANDYLRKYEGEMKIRELARGYYEDIDGLGTLDIKSCEEIKSKKKTVPLKVINRDNVSN